MCIVRVDSVEEKYHLKTIEDVMLIIFLSFQAPYNVVSYFLNADEDENTQCFMLYESTGEIILLRSLMLEPCLGSEFNVSIDLLIINDDSLLILH